MILVQKENRQLTIDDAALDYYLSSGYVVVTLPKEEPKEEKKPKKNAHK